jgi:hypothetical protein
MRGFLVQVEPEFLRRGLTPRVERRSRRRLAVALASLAAVVLFAALATSAGAFNYDQGYKVLVSTTGNHSELTDHLDITATQGQSPTVVMSLRLPSLLAGDRLDIGSELEVTTDCLNSGGHCGRYADGSVGNPYTYNPFVDTQLVLTSGANRTVGKHGHEHRLLHGGRLGAALPRPDPIEADPGQQPDGHDDQQRGDRRHHPAGGDR